MAHRYRRSRTRVVCPKSKNLIRPFEMRMAAEDCTALSLAVSPLATGTRSVRNRDAKISIGTDHFKRSISNDQTEQFKFQPKTKLVFPSPGSKEGWTPSQFISRKNDRSKKRDYKPEDFMDDEDFGEFGIAPKQVKAKEKFFSTTESFAGFRDHLSRASTIDDVLKEVVTLNAVSIGVRILKRMKKNAVQKLSNVGYLTGDRIFPLEFDENDLKSFFLNPKKNLNGLGYTGLRTNVNFASNARLEQSATSEFSTLMKDGKKLKISGEAFGFGALDEDDGFEAEVYTSDDLSKYDYTLGGGNKQPNRAGHLFNSILSDSHLMDDFTKSEEELRDRLSDSRYQITVPPDWTPRPPVNSKKGKRKSRWDECQGAQEEQKTFQKRSLDANQRAEILGEDQGSLEREQIDLQIEAKLSKVKEARLSEVGGKPAKLSSAEESIGEFRSLEEQVTIKQEEPKFKKPLTGFFASKFIQSTNTPLDVLKPGLTKIENLPQTSRPPAAKVTEETKSFVGKSNREIYQWHPHKLLCKRFNVPHPYPQFPDVVGILAFNKSKPSSSLDAFLAPTATAPTKAAPQPVKREVVAEVIEEFKKPDMNLFKAVFDLSDDDEDDLSDIEEIEESSERTAGRQAGGQSPAAQASDSKLGNKLDEKLSNKLSNELGHKSSESKAPPDNNPPKIVFNKSFVKKSVDSSKERAEEKKSKPKVSLNLFESEMNLSDEEGLNLLEIKRMKSAKREEPTDQAISRPVRPVRPEPVDQRMSRPDRPVQPEPQLEQHEREVHRRESDGDRVEAAGFSVRQDSLKEPIGKHPEDLAISAKNIEPIKLSDSDSDHNLDDLIDAIMKPESASSHSSSRKKKRKKHKEHKKHKKHKRSSRDSD